MFIIDIKKKQSYPIKGEITFIGKKNNNDIVIDYDGISDRHALIIQKEDDYYLIDLVSRLGTYKDGSKIEQPLKLNDGDVVCFDTREFEISMKEIPQEAAEPKPAFHEPPPKAPSLEKQPETPQPATSGGKTMVVTDAFTADTTLGISLPDGSQKEVPINKKYTYLIARTPIDDKTIVIDDISISRNGHCKILYDNNQWVIIDNDSTNGVFDGNKKIKWAPMLAGKKFHVGNAQVFVKSRQAASADFQKNQPKAAPNPIWDKTTIVDADHDY